MTDTTLSRRSHILLAMLLVLAAASLALSRQEHASAATITVNILTDPVPDGSCPASCSLREAIIAANANPDVDTIEFNIAGSGPHTFTPDSALPSISESVTITGICATCDGAALNTAAAWAPSNLALKIVLSGEDVATAGTPGLRVTGGGVIIRGLVINNWTGAGVQIDGTEPAAIEGSIIGANVTGTVAAPNQRGIVFTSGGNSNVGNRFPEGRNIISGNTNEGIRACAAGADGITIEGNFIGTNASGTGAVPNGDGIILCTADNFSIGDGLVGAGNLVSGNTGEGIRVASSVAPFIQGNRVGTTANGMAALPNGSDGIALIDTPSALVGGGTAADGNLLSGNVEFGLTISNSDFPDVRSNTIGLDLVRTAALPNGSGIGMLTSTDAVIRENWISGNTGIGIILTNGADISVINNRIGNPDGATLVGNGSSGVFIQGAVTRVDIGVGPSDGNNIIGNGGNGIHISSPATDITVEDNLIAGNSLSGILVAGGTGITIGSLNIDEVNEIASNGGDGINVTVAASRAQIIGNLITNNGTSSSDLGIDLSPNGVNLNDALDADVGPNTLQNTPVILEAFSNGVESFARVRLESTPNSQFTIEIFADGTICTPGRLDATTLLARRISALTDSNGVFEEEISLTGAGAGIAITATATDQATLVTSELSSACAFIEHAVFIDTPGAPASFQPANRFVQRGTSVAFVNRHNVSHTVTSDLKFPASDPYFTSGFLSPDDVYRFNFDASGTFTYFCQVHPNMQGTVTVQGDNEVPDLNSVVDDHAFPATGPIEVDISGAYFTSLTTLGFFDGGVQVGGNLEVTARSDTELTVVLTNTQLANIDTYEIRATNPAPGGGTAGISFRVVRWPTDVQCDLDIDAEDALAILRKLAGFTSGILPLDCGIDPIVPNADVDRDGSETLADALFARRRIAGLAKDIE